MSWQPPSPPSARLPALHLYIAGETACDSGDVAAGQRAFKAAFALSWELGTDNWPGWALCMYTRLHAGLPVLPDAAPEVFVGSEEHGGCDGTWHTTAESIACIGAQLKERNFAVIDNFAGAKDAASLRAACISLAECGAYVSAKGRVRDGGRSDSVVWEPESGFESLVRRTDALLEQLQGSCSELRSVTSRQRAMISRYGCDDFFARHVDNACVDGHGPHCSPRVLTMCYYMQSAVSSDAERAEVTERTGGCLRIFRPQCKLADASAAAADSRECDTGADALVDIAPIADRMVIFYSDFRCPHEVLPVRGADTERFAATVWYLGPTALPEFWTSEMRRSHLEGDHDRIPLQRTCCPVPCSAESREISAAV